MFAIFIFRTPLRARRLCGASSSPCGAAKSSDSWDRAAPASQRLRKFSSARRGVLKLVEQSGAIVPRRADRRTRPDKRATREIARAQRAQCRADDLRSSQPSEPGCPPGLRQNAHRRRAIVARDREAVAFLIVATARKLTRREHCVKCLISGGRRFGKLRSSDVRRHVLPHHGRRRLAPLSTDNGDGGSSQEANGQNIGRTKVAPPATTSSSGRPTRQ